MSLPSRRAFLGAVAVVGAGAAGAVAGWSTTQPARRSGTGASSAGPGRGASSAGPGPAPGNGPSAGPAAVLEAAVAREVDLLARLDAAVTAVPALRASVEVLRADHRAHLASLQALAQAAGGTSPTTPTSTLPPLPTVPGVLTAPLGVWERAAAASAARDSARLDGGAAVVLAAISASEATHAAWLA